MIAAAGGHAHVFAASSGAALALEAARQRVAIDRLVTYEAPFILDDTHAPNDPDLPQQLQAMVDDGRRGDAVKTFMKTVGAPSPGRRPDAPAAAVEEADGGGPHAPLRPVDRGAVRAGPAVAHRLLRRRALPDAGDRRGKSPDYLRNAQAAIAAAVPGGELRVLPGQTHMIKPKVVAPVVTAHLVPEGER